MCSVVAAVAARRTLVLLDALDDKDAFSVFFDSLATRGHTLTYRLANNTSNVLENEGVRLYDNVVVLAPRAEDYGAFDASDLARFVNDLEGNVLFAFDKQYGDAASEFATELDIRVSKIGTELMDHFSFDKDTDDGNHTMVRTGPMLRNHLITGEESHPALFKGVGLTIKHPKTSLLFPIARAQETTYVANATKPVKKVVSNDLGKRIVLIAGMQGRNNARVIVSGSMDMFKNKVAKFNGAHIAALTKWCMHERGILRLTDAKHSTKDGRVGVRTRGSMNPTYRVHDVLTYSVTIAALQEDLVTWAPYVTDGIQVEFMLLKTVVRQTMQHVGDGVYQATFESPGTPGVYKFRVHYERMGYTSLSSVSVVTLRPVETGDHAHFVGAAYPYYASFVLLALGFVRMLSGLRALETPEKVKKE